MLFTVRTPQGRQCSGNALVIVAAFVTFGGPHVSRGLLRSLILALHNDDFYRAGHIFDSCGFDFAFEKVGASVV